MKSITWSKSYKNALRKLTIKETKFKEVKPKKEALWKKMLNI
jgi:hypothetical protein